MIMIRSSKALFFILLLLCAGGGLHSATLLLDDFNSGTAVNRFGGANSAWAGSGASSSAAFYANPGVILGRTGYSLRLNYDVSTYASYAGYALNLNHRSVQGYNYLSFWIRGASGGEFFKVELKCRDPYALGNTRDQSNRAFGRSYITDYLDSGVTTAWQKVVIPLDTFNSIDQWTNMWEMTVTFENTQLEGNGGLPKTGTIYLDDIVFGTWEPGYVRIDHYGDLISICGFGGNMGYGGNAGGWCTNLFHQTEFHNARNSLQIDYNVSAGYCWSFSMFGGGIAGASPGFIPIQGNFSNYNYFTFWAKSTNENIYNRNTPTYRGLKVELNTNDTSGASWPWFQFPTTPISNIWLKFSLPLTNFKFWGAQPPINKKKIAKLAWVLDNGFILAADRIGRIFIDDVQFEKAGYAPDSANPVTPSLFKCGNTLLTNNFVFGLTNTLSARADSDAIDPTLEGVSFEYSLDGGTSWYVIGADYATADEQYSAQWNTSAIENNAALKVRVYAWDASGNKSGAVVYSGQVVNEAPAGSDLFVKPAQKVLTPNSDGINDTLNFTGLEPGWEIMIYSVKGLLVKKITEETFWDGKDKNGKVAESGIYIYQVKSGGAKIEGTVLVVK